jgi:hypothetical protein
MRKVIFQKIYSKAKELQIGIYNLSASEFPPSATVNPFSISIPLHPEAPSLLYYKWACEQHSAAFLIPSIFATKKFHS